MAAVAKNTDVKWGALATFSSAMIIAPAEIGIQQLCNKSALTRRQNYHAGTFLELAKIDWHLPAVSTVGNRCETCRIPTAPGIWRPNGRCRAITGLSDNKNDSHNAAVCGLL